MNRKTILCALLVAFLVLMAGGPVFADKNAPPPSGPSVHRGDPPPGNATSLSIPQARAMLKHALGRRYIGTIRSCQRVLMIKGCETIVTSPATGIRVTSRGFELAAPYTYHLTAAGRPSPDDGKVSVNFKKDQNYIQVFIPNVYPGTKSKVSVEPNPLYKTGYLPDPQASQMGTAICSWTDQAAAQEFADAFNRLLYAAYRNEEEVEFHNAAKAWRESPNKPGLNEEANRHRVLAENAIQERNLPSAIEHYQSGVEAQPMWPEGWFNLAMLQAEQNNHSDAAYSMKHYLELMPDAPDAKDARDQMIIWEDKAKQEYTAKR